MNMIAAIAQLSLCKRCEMHGCIVFGDGSKSEEFFSTEDAFTVISDALLTNKLIEVEAKFLRDEIRKSSLPTDAEVEVTRQALEEVAHAFECFIAGETEQSAQAEIPPNRTLH